MSDDLDFDMEVLSGDETELSSTSSNGEVGDDGEIEGGPSSKSREKSALDETSSGEPPDDWSLIRLGEIASDTHYGASESAEDFDSDKPRYVRIKDIDELGRLKSEEKASLSWDKADGYILEEGDMLFARSGSVGRTYLYDPEDGDCCHGGYTINHKLRSDSVNHRYLHQYTKSPLYWKWIERIARTGAQANINAREYSSLLIPLPPLPEQRKIASVLYVVDQVIQKTEAIIEQAKRVKRGLMQLLLTCGIDGRGNIRDPDEDDFQESSLGAVPQEWSVHNLGNDFDIEYGTEKKEKELVSQGYPVYGANGVIGRSEEYLYEDPVVTVTCRGATCGTVNLTKPKSWVTNNSLVLVSDSTFNEHFLAEALRYHSVERAISGSAQAQITSGMLAKMDYPVPSIEEQDRIAEFLTTWEEDIHHEKKWSNQLKRLKKGLMQDLLTGKVRTADKAIDVLDEVIAHG